VVEKVDGLDWFTLSSVLILVGSGVVDAVFDVAGVVISDACAGGGTGN